MKASLTGCSRAVGPLCEASVDEQKFIMFALHRLKPGFEKQSLQNLNDT